jgi:chemotaxis protein methyltransferase CheR
VRGTLAVRSAEKSPPAISKEGFEYVRDLVRRRAAIVLEAGKEYLVESRLGFLTRETGLSSVDELVTALRRGSDEELQMRVVEALCTNETSFFRDAHPFETLRGTILPQLLTRRATERRIRIWCSACSSGQEPYSIAMLLKEERALAGWDVGLLASDFSETILERARNGQYSQHEVNRGLVGDFLVKYFEKDGLTYRAKEDLRGAIEFRRLNLALAWPKFPRMDIIFMRNVLIYFEAETKKEILARVRRVLAPDGYLFLGSTETTLNLDDAFHRETIGKTVCYRIRG